MNELSARFQYFAERMAEQQHEISSIQAAILDLRSVAGSELLIEKMNEIMPLFDASEVSIQQVIDALEQLENWSAPPPAPVPAPTPAPTPTPTPAPEQPRYRTQQRHLFSRTDVASIPPRIGGSPLSREAGPTWDFVSIVSHGSGGYTKIGPWTNPGGDFIDRNGVKQGSTPFSTCTLNAVSGNTTAYDYEVDITDLVKKVQADDRFFAILLKTAGSGIRRFAGRFADDGTPTNPNRPRVIIQYSSGEVTSEPLITASTGSKKLPVTVTPMLSFPAMLEFDRPTAETIISAKLKFRVLEHWQGTSTMSVFLIDPPLELPQPIPGIAASSQLDAGLSAHPDIIGCHRYLDGTAFADIALTVPGPTTGNAWNTGAENNFDPEIYGTGPRDETKLPYIGLGKWVNARFQGPCDLVQSTYQGDNFVPLAPGIGAMRWEMKKEVFADGDMVYYVGTGGAHAKIMLPPSVFGSLPRIFVRHYFRFASSSEQDPPGGYQVRQTPTGSPVWTWALGGGGKFGLMPSHETPAGGVSGTSGGGYGWQMRMGWHECDYDGPDKGGINIYPHLYDFQQNNPIGHRYGASDSPKGGKSPKLFGSTVYPDTWYCFEAELLCNTVMPESPGYLPDGALRIWLDGRLIYDATELVIRSLPLDPRPYNPNSMRPVRDLGIRELWFNWFHGGTVKNTKKRVLFLTAPAWGHSYIGPMAR